MTIDQQTCPICGAINPAEVRECAICGARLTGRAFASATTEDDEQPINGFYRSEMGEDDLMVARAPIMAYLIVGVLLVGVLAAGGVFLAFTWAVDDDPSPNRGGQTTLEDLGTDTATPDLTFTALYFMFQPSPTPTISRTPPPPLPTVTPTIASTETPGPCVVTVREGDTLYGLATVCGHRDLAIIPQIVELNGLACDSCQQIGQELQIPRPTPLPDAEGESSQPSDAAAPQDIADLSVEELVERRQVAAEPTLDSNLQFHIIQSGQTMFDIVAMYNIDVTLLSEINPEVDFLQCDFGERFGGPNCSVMFFQGQRIRVPAPTATPTIPPTPSGSETPTPSPTPTFNVPSAFAPPDGADLPASQIVTLRWATTGTLGTDEVYQVTVTHLDSGQTYTGITCDLLFDLPSDWQADEPTFEAYEWTVNLAQLTPFPTTEGPVAVHASGLELCDLSFALDVEWRETPTGLPNLGFVDGVTLADPRYATQAREFFWQGRAPEDAS
ncbi:MAG: LysM peptidoglycan-binding domain-containing protein [Anaerolineales bacterium]